MDRQEAENGQDSTDVAPHGRALVRERLIAPLMALPRPRKTSAERHQKDMDTLAEKLAYLGAQQLDGLAELALRTSRGKCCPEAGLIRAWAYAMEPPPPRSSDYAMSLMRSVMGRAAMDGGYAVELLRHARRAGPPPQAYLLHKIREEADLNRRRRAGIREAEAAGRAAPDDLRWLKAWWDDHGLCQSLLKLGDEMGDAA